VTSHSLLFGLTVFAGIGCGLIGGLLFAFSNFVMKALSRQPPESAIRTMQSINVLILNPLFLVFFLGTALAAIALVFFSALQPTHPGLQILSTGCVLYVVGVFGATMALHVPRNNRLAAQDPSTAETARYWRSYVAEWTRWNHVRTAAALLAAACYMVALREIQDALLS
jgi:uncharacterized membrane protein